MRGFVFPGENPPQHWKRGFLCLSKQQWQLAPNNYSKIKELRKTVVYFDQFLLQYVDQV